jgi:hypothetical protein
MMIRSTVAALALVVALPAMAVAQSKTNFSGTWNVDAAKSDPPPRGGGGAGATARLVITQTALDMTVVVTTGRGDAKTTYKLDGSEMKESAAMGESRAKASWDGPRLVVSRVQNVSTPQGAFEITSKETYSLSGGILTVVTTRNSPMGNTSRTTVFTKG